MNNVEKSVVLLTSILILTTTLSASPNLLRQVPSTPHACHLCHEAGMGHGINAFGRDVAELLARDEVNWSVLYHVDSDGDGQSNGMELGDPCGVWVPGDLRGRSGELGHPGDVNTLSSSPMEGCPEGEAPPENFFESPSIRSGTTIRTDNIQRTTGCANSSSSAWTFTMLLSVFYIGFRLRSRYFRYNA